MAAEVRVRHDRVMARQGGVRRARWPRVGTFVALLIALLASAAATWGVHSAVRDQEHRLLTERGSELNLVLTSAIGPITASLSSQGELLSASHGSRTAYENSAEAAVADNAKTSTNPVSFGWVKPAAVGGGWVVVAAAGDTLQRGEERRVGKECWARWCGEGCNRRREGRGAGQAGTGGEGER